MQIGPHSLPNRLFVAPMAGVTDRPFRQLCRGFGAGYGVLIPASWEAGDMIKTMLRAAVAALAFSLCAPALAQHGEGAPAAAQSPTSAEARRADIAFFRDNFMARDVAYSASARAEAEQRLSALEAQAASVSQVYFELELARIVALADNGHTAYFPGPRSRRFNRIGQVRFSPMGEDFYVLRADPQNADLLGARLVAIDGHPIAELRETARTLSELR